MGADVFPHSLGGLNHLPGRPGLTEAAINAGFVVVIDRTQRAMESRHLGSSLTIEASEELSIDDRAHIGDMLRRADEFHLPRSGWAGDCTAAAAHAFLRVHKGFLQPGCGILFHLNRVKLASFPAFAATFAFS
jgi:hypothetical protein